MPMIKTLVDEAACKHLLSMRDCAGVPSVTVPLKECDICTDRGEAGEIDQRAPRIAGNRPSGFRSGLRDLFPHTQREHWSKGARQRGRKLFFDAGARPTHDTRAVQKSSSNHRYYELP